MAKFALCEGDVTTLTRAFNALREGMGTYLPETATLDGFLAEWKDSTSAFASEEGFIALGTDNHPQGAATVVLCQFQAGAVSAELGDQFRKLSRELLKGFDLQVIRAGGRTVEANRLLTLSGFMLDGDLRRLVPDASGVLQNLCMFSLTVDDLVTETTEPANFVYNGSGASETDDPRQEALPLGA